jgi:hypothetical protein
MLSSKDIKKTLSEIPHGETMSVENIQDWIEQHNNLDDQDWEPHTTTRPTKYPMWKHRVQAVLEEYKKQGIVTHCEATHRYMF